MTSSANPAPRTRPWTVALVGRANSGKTSLVMHLTGSSQRPINFPGTSVERTESRVLVDGRWLAVVDLPGIASLQPISRDELVTLDYLRGNGSERPDALCAVLDASKLSVELRLLQQLRQLSLPLVVAMTKVDVAEAEGRPIDTAQLQRALGVPLLPVNAHNGVGVAELRQVLLATDQPAAAGADDTSDAGGGSEELAARVQAQTATRRTWTDRLDAVLLHPLFGPLSLALLLLAMFLLVFTVAEPFVEVIEAGQGAVSGFVGGLLPGGALRSFVVNGLINGLGSAFVFVPQIALLIAMATILESSGYMARAVFLLDRLLRKVGLTGRSFVPLTSSFACAIPGILASRIIDDERDRLATIAVSPLMSCSARLPVYVVLIGAFFPAWQAGFVLFLLYTLGIVTAAVVALLLRRTVLRGGRSLLAMELPSYQRPSARVVLGQVGIAVKEFLVTAGSIILIATIVVWALSYYPRPDALHQRYEGLRAAVVAGPEADAQRTRLDAQEAGAYLEQSWLARIGKGIEPVFRPAGFDWRTTVGILSAFPARELIIPTLGTLYSLGDVEADADRPSPALREALQQARDEHGQPVMTRLDALSLMAFFALCSQCIATLGAIKRETHSWRWPLFVFGYMTTLAWLAAVAIHQVGSWLGYGGA